MAESKLVQLNFKNNGSAQRTAVELFTLIKHAKCKYPCSLDTSFIDNNLPT